jgi:RluA family pseudouridine synthase
MKKRLLTVASADPLLLVDFLANRLALPMDAALELVRRGAVYVDDQRIVDEKHKLTTGKRIKVHASRPAPSETWREIFVNARMVVVEKPHGMLSQRSPSELEGALDEEVQKRYPDARLLHRLDRAVSGLVLFGRGAACAELQTALSNGRVRREYVAVVSGQLQGEGDIRLRIARHRNDARLRQALPENESAGEAAWTHYRTLAQNAERSLVALRLETGRTHQIRVHLSSIGHPIIGDQDYGGPPHTRLLLHSHRLTLFDEHLLQDVAQTFESPLPPDFAV